MRPDNSSVVSSSSDAIPLDGTGKPILTRPCPIGEFVSLITRDYRYANVNASHAEAQGMTVQELAGRNLEEIWGADVFRGVIQKHLDACLAGDVIHYQSWFDFPKTGRRFWEVSYYPYREEGGEITHAMVVTRDMTEQKRSADLLDLEANVLDLIARGLPLRGILRVLREKLDEIVPGVLFLVRRINRKTRELEVLVCPEGLDPDAPEMRPILPGPGRGACGSSAFMRQPVRVESPLDQRWKDIQIAGEATTIEYAISFPIQGASESILGTVGFYYPEGIRSEKHHPELLEFAARLAGVALDRHNAEQDRVQLTTAILQAGEAIILTDTEGFIQFVNPAFERDTGYSVEEALGQNIAMLDSGKEVESFRNLVMGELRRGNLWSGKFINKRKNGSFYENESTVTPVFDSEGEMISFVSVQRDVTDQTNLENQLRQSQKMEAVGQLAGGVAHDFNNILQGIYGASEMALMEVAEDSPIRHDLEDILRSAERGSGLVRQLLTFSRRNFYEPSAVSLNTLVRDHMKMMTRILGDGNDIIFLPESDLPELWGDRGQIEQVLLNLLLNSKDAMSEGGRILIQTAKTVPPRGMQFFPTEPERKPYVRLSISDSGHGIPMEIQEHIFEPFFTTKEIAKGTGLGLSIVFGIIKQHQGVIHFESRRGGGTRFDLYFPLASCFDPINKEGESPPPRDLGHGEWILLAEDNDQIRETTAIMLRNAGYEVLEASDGEEAAEVFQEHLMDTAIALLDVRMPKRSGPWVYEAIRRVRPNLPVIFATGYSEEILGEALIKDVNLGVLHKPFREQELLSRIAGALRPPTS